MIRTELGPRIRVRNLTFRVRLLIMALTCGKLGELGELATRWWWPWKAGNRCSSGSRQANSPNTRGKIIMDNTALDGLGAQWST